MCVHIHVCVHMCVRAHARVCVCMPEEDKRGVGSSEAWLFEEVVSYLTCVLETKLRFPERATLALNL